MLNNLSRRHLIALAAAGSAALFFGALAFQYIGGLMPCAMCLWQRWPHRVAIALGLVGVVFPHRAVAALGALSALAGAGIALLHTGVERGWWDGPQVCGAAAAQDLGSLSADALFDTTSGPLLVLCNEAAWSFAGLSMASWNGIFSLGLAAIWTLAALHRA